MSKEKITRGDLDHAMEGTSGNRVFCSIARTINTGNYESLRLEFGQSVVVADGESFAEAKERVREEAMTELADMVETLSGAIKE